MALAISCMRALPAGSDSTRRPRRIPNSTAITPQPKMMICSLERNIFLYFVDCERFCGAVAPWWARKMTHPRAKINGHSGHDLPQPEPVANQQDNEINELVHPLDDGLQQDLGNHAFGQEL